MLWCGAKPLLLPAFVLTWLYPSALTWDISLNRPSHLRCSQERYSSEALRSYSLGKVCPIPAVLAMHLEHDLPSCFSLTSNKCSNINSNSHSHKESGQSTSCQAVKQTLQKFTPSYQEVLDKHDTASASKDVGRQHVEGNFAFHTLWHY